MTDLSPETVERMVGHNSVTLSMMTEAEAKALWYKSDDGSEPVMTAHIAVAMLKSLGLILPEPVDPDEAVARQMVLDEDVERTARQRQGIADGRAGQRKVALVLAAIKRGRALATGDQ